MKNIYAWTAAVLWTVGILMALALPSQSLPQSSPAGLDKVVHFTLFFVFSVLWMQAGSSRLLPVWVLIGGLIYGIGTEYVQGILSIGRTPDPIDAAINAAGTVSGIACHCMWYRKKLPDND